MKTKEIFSIFSKKKSFERQKPIENLKVIIDYREKNSFVPSELIKLGIEVEFKELKVADYIAGNVAIERKTISDFISSMINHRLLNQLEELQQYPDKLLIIEGIGEKELYNDNSEGMNANAIRGFLLSILLRHKIPIIFTKNAEDTSRYILVLLKKREKEAPLKVKKKNMDKKEQLQFIIESFPGVGPKTSKKLLEKFKTMKNVFNAGENELREVLGKKGKLVFRIINEVYQ